MGCGASMRSRGLASALMKTRPVEGVSNLKEWVRLVKVDNLKIAEIDKITGRVKYLVPAYYHGSGERDNLVYWEFGGDFVKKNKLKILYEKKKNGLYVFGLRKSGMV